MQVVRQSILKKYTEILFNGLNDRKDGQKQTERPSKQRNLDEKGNIFESIQNRFQHNRIEMSYYYGIVFSLKEIQNRFLYLQLDKKQ